MTPGLPHHRGFPRIDERRSDPGDERAVVISITVAYALALCVLAAIAAGW